MHLLQHMEFIRNACNTFDKFWCVLKQMQIPSKSDTVYRFTEQRPAHRFPIIHRFFLGMSPLR